MKKMFFIGIFVFCSTICPMQPQYNYTESEIREILQQTLSQCLTDTNANSITITLSLNSSKTRTSLNKVLEIEPNSTLALFPKTLVAEFVDFIDVDNFKVRCNPEELQHFSPEEIKALFAHEIGHLVQWRTTAYKQLHKKAHAFRLTSKIANKLNSLFLVLLQITSQSSTQNTVIPIGGMCVAILSIAQAICWKTYCSYSHMLEYEADKYAFMRYPCATKQMLETLSKIHPTPPNYDPTTDTHPSWPQRVKALNNLEQFNEQQGQPFLDNKFPFLNS